MYAPDHPVIRDAPNWRFEVEAESSGFVPSEDGEMMVAGFVCPFCGMERTVIELVGIERELIVFCREKKQAFVVLPKEP